MDASFDRNVVFDIGNIFHLHTNIKKLETTHFIGCIKLTIFRQLGMEPHDSGNRPPPSVCRGYRRSSGSQSHSDWQSFRMRGHKYLTTTVYPMGKNCNDY